MSFFERIGTILKSNLNDLISRAEDPQKMLEQAIGEMREQLVDAKSRVAVAIADEKRLVKEIERHRKEAREWEQKAMAAVRAERDDLAVRALDKKKQSEAVVQQLEPQLAGQQQAVAALKHALGAINEKIEEANREKALLLARTKRAEAQRAVAETLAATHDPKALAPMDKLNEKVDRLEAEAQARLEVAAISAGTPTENSLDAELRQLAAPVVNDDLLDLKKKMALLDAGEQRALPPSTDDADSGAEGGDASSDGEEP